MKELSPSMINMATILNGLKDGKEYLTDDLREKLKAPEGYGNTQLGRRLNLLKQRGFVDNKIPKIHTGHRASKLWIINDLGRIFLNENVHMIQDPDQYDLTFISSRSNREQPPKEPSVAQQELQYSPTANAAMDEIGDLVSLSTDIESALKTILALFDQLDRDFKLDNALEHLGLDDQTLIKLSSIGLFKNITVLANDVNFKIQKIKGIRLAVEEALNEQS